MDYTVKERIGQLSLLLFPLSTSLAMELLLSTINNIDMTETHVLKKFLGLSY